MSLRSLVIVAVDDSPEMERTVEYAVSVAKARAAELHTVQVVPLTARCGAHRRMKPSSEHD